MEENKIEFKRIRIEDIDILRKYTLKARNRSCEFAIINVLYWNDTDVLKYAIIDDILVYRAVDNKDAVYSPLEFPENLVDFMAKIQKDAQTIGERLILNNLTERMIRRMEREFVGEFDFGFNRNGSDYIYSVSELSTLSGSKFHGKKNHLNKFLKNYDFVYEEISRDNIEDCRIMKNKWGERKAAEEKMETLDRELEVIDEVFDKFDIFDIKGGLIRIDGEVVAFTLGEAVSEDTFVTHFEKAYDDIPGLYQAINQQFAANTISDFVYVNREDDMGEEGLRKAKLSYKPVMMSDKYLAVKTLYFADDDIGPTGTSKEENSLSESPLEANS